MKLPVFPPLWRRSSTEGPDAVPFAQSFFVLWVRRVLRIGATLAVAGTLAVGCYVLAVRFNDFVRHSEFFDISKVEVIGASPALEQEIYDLVDALTSEGRKNLLMLRLEPARLLIEDLARVRSAALRKRYPGTLTIKVEERIALAVANTDGLYWLDIEGVLLARATAEEVAEAHAPLVTGLRGSNFFPGMRVEQARLNETLRTIRFLKDNDPDLGRRFSEWHMSAENEVTAIMNPGIEVRFGDNDPLTRLMALASVLRVEKDIERYTYLDLRFDSQVILF